MFSSFVNQVNIIGTTKPKNPKINDLVFNKDGSCEIFCGDSWVNYATTTTIPYNKYYDKISTIYEPYEPKVEYRELKPSICSCCGAPLRSNKCEYCGMEYR